MPSVSRAFISLSDEKRKEIVQHIIDFFSSERDEEIGLIAAEHLLEFFLQELGGDIYNRGVEDAKALFKTRFQDIELDVDALLRQ